MPVDAGCGWSAQTFPLMDTVTVFTIVAAIRAPEAVFATLCSVVTVVPARYTPLISDLAAEIDALAARPALVARGQTLGRLPQRPSAFGHPPPI